MNIKPARKSRILFPCWALIVVCLWFRFTSIGDQKVHRNGWIPGGGSRAATRRAFRRCS